MNEIDKLFQRLAAQKRKAFIPFITAGDPSLPVTCRLIEELSRRGASLVELGFPYSDPIADGPVIQASYTRALRGGVTLQSIFEAVRETAARNDASPPLEPAEAEAPAGRVPLVAMVSYAIVLRHGLEPFVTAAKKAGFEGAIVPDLPVEEASDLAAAAAKHDFKLILLVTPTTPRSRAIEIARVSTGFIYFVSITGITGERTTISSSVVDQIAWLKSQTPLPICIGFGISRPEHIRMLAPVADGVIVGSAIVRRITEGAGQPPDRLAAEVGDYVATLMDALRT